VSGQRTLEGWCERAEGQVDRGEHFATALLREGIDLDQIHELVTALKPVMEFRHCREGDRFTLLRSPSGRTERFVYRQSPLLSFQAHRRGSRLLGKRVEERSEVEVASIAVRVDGSLYASLEGAGETAALVMLIVDIFAWDIDFYVDTRRGDTVRLLVEKHRLNGQFVRYGRILAAEYRGEVGNRRAFYYESDKEGGATGYYDAEGGSLRKAFLKSPLKFVRVTSGFGMRVHPILGFSAMHAGIDFAAPTGTPVWAPADGAVTFSGAKGANGNLVTLRHANGYETAYAHLQSIARGVRTGARVRQKQIIGYVGNTGRSTGPHLHFGMRRHGKEINPLKQTFPPADPVPKAELPRYLQVTAPLLEKLLAIPLASLRTATLGAGAKGTG
jgi:murein DD-endopeptidase MepM/ murein hydrolase activator NlpD